MNAIPTIAVLDSNILIDFLNGRPEARDVIAAMTDRFMSVISRTETLTGTVDSDAIAGAHRLFKQCRMLAVTAEIANRAAIIRQQTRLRLPDALIAATALVHGLPILTRDRAMLATGDIGALMPYQLQ